MKISKLAVAHRFEALRGSGILDCYRQLPEEVRRLADQKFDLLKADPRHSSVRLKKVGQFWSARIGLHYRALAKDRVDGLVWFWIGPHSAYDKFRQTHN